MWLPTFTQRRSHLRIEHAIIITVLFQIRNCSRPWHTFAPINMSDVRWDIILLSYYHRWYQSYPVKMTTTIRRREDQFRWSQSFTFNRLDENCSLLIGLLGIPDHHVGFTRQDVSCLVQWIRCLSDCIRVLWPGQLRFLIHPFENFFTSAHWQIRLNSEELSWSRPIVCLFSLEALGEYCCGHEQPQRSPDRTRLLLFCKRYCPEYSIICMIELRKWMQSYASIILNGIYLEYLSWAAR